ncbi:exodeoxyribonuclease V subunit alpha [Nocardioides daeguensis]|uniref:RecBCD enzyme subunit RecD n=1 Tax=Nocardioides daeguensis TaxID=908359 RepID=A0ABP6V339_9ACTN|nr:exodeoxyribonuclease V subunit alpha [Nocardioides daeguensis]MBV6726536.1 exodeoxyribonuclease V subunit alpha [Nocardioides daeguensis]MCR1772379.1 exodeoxyribonuclease V subunit alpha [Nocardioides daeguensis]
MTEIFEPTSAHDPRLALRVGGLLGSFNAAGIVDAADVRVAERVAALAGEDDERVLLAAALAVRSVRGGSVGLDLGSLPELDGTELLWPERAEWLSAIESSALVAAEVLHVEHDLVYLDRYHRLERQVADDLTTRIALGAPAVDEAVLAATLRRVSGEHLSGEQAAAVEHAARHRTTVLTGGPGTGKTTTVARLVLALADQFAVAHDRRMSIALAAPTGKAATRLEQAVEEELRLLGALGDGPGHLPPPRGVTLHRLLGWRPDNATRFRHDRGNRLKHDLVVVDEASMVDLTMMARLLEAVRPDSRLVLVGDPRQLTSVGAGAVLSDLVAGFADHPDPPVVALTENHRSTEEIKGLAAALRDDSPDAADRVLEVLRAGTGEVTWIETDDPVAALQAECTTSALRVRDAAVERGPEAALAAIDDFRLLCAHRDGPYGVRVWNRHVEQWLAAELGAPLGSAWYAGRPLLVTSNDYALDVYNGETGVVVTDASGRPRAWIAGAGAPRPFAPGRLDAIETMHAMTVHKSQGSQATRIAVLLPEEGSRLLSRELFYTAVTRARASLLVVGSEAAVRAAVTTTAQRATGLRHRLAP